MALSTTLIHTVLVQAQRRLKTQIPADWSLSRTVTRALSPSKLPILPSNTL